jgi:hypothetical protein
MVRSLLDGRKTQTRRILKYGDYHDVEKTHRSPYGEPGDRLWVRETWALADGHVAPAGTPCYRANLPDEDASGIKWRPGIFMPRWVSRITLEVTETRVERVHDISLDDARAEGIPQMFGEAVELGLAKWSEGDTVIGGAGGGPNARDIWDNRTSVENFATLWDSINAERGHPWAQNPWVWVITFKVLPR